jgi:multiple sugar transport system ATP-binding protein
MDGATKFVAGFRPEHLELGDVPNSATIRAKADVVEFLGDEELLHVTVQGHEGDVVAVVSSENRVKPGDILDLKLPLEKLHLFNQETGDAIAWSKAEAAA